MKTLSSSSNCVLTLFHVLVSIQLLDFAGLIVRKPKADSENDQSCDVGEAFEIIGRISHNALSWVRVVSADSTLSFGGIP